MCQLPSDCKPSVRVYKQILLRNVSCTLEVNTEGLVIIYPSSSIPSGYNAWLDETFII